MLKRPQTAGLAGSQRPCRNHGFYSAEARDSQELTRRSAATRNKKRLSCPRNLVPAAAAHLRSGNSYWGRTYEEGKKIGWKDGVRCLWCLVKYSIDPAEGAGLRLRS
jgi:hypothetical protein